MDLIPLRQMVVDVVPGVLPGRQAWSLHHQGIVSRISRAGGWWESTISQGCRCLAGDIIEMAGNSAGISMLPLVDKLGKSKRISS